MGSIEYPLGTRYVNDVCTMFVECRYDTALELVQRDENAYKTVYMYIISFPPLYDVPLLMTKHIHT